MEEGSLPNESVTEGRRVSGNEEPRMGRVRAGREPRRKGDCN